MGNPILWSALLLVAGAAWFWHLANGAINGEHDGRPKR